MNKIERMYLLKGSFPDMVKIVSKKNNIDKMYDYANSETFLNEYKELLYLSKREDYEVVQIFIAPPRCRMIWFEGSAKVGTGGWINLKKVNEIDFYEYDENTHTEIFEDIFIKYISLDNKYIKKALTDISYLKEKTYLREYETNIDMADAGRKLVEFAKFDYYFDMVNNEMIPLGELANKILTDEQLVKTINKKYNLLDKIFYNKKLKNEKKLNQIIVNTIYALFYAIFLCEGNFNDIRQIIREMIEINDTTDENIEIIKEKYKKLANYLKSNSEWEETESITFNKFEEIVESKIDYQLLLRCGALMNFGFYIKKFDFKKKIVYLDVSYL